MNKSKFMKKVGSVSCSFWRISPISLPTTHFDAALIIKTVAADTASPREHTLLVKRTLGVSHSSSATGAPPVRRGNGKRQKTAAARKDLCCFCSISSSCTSRNCPCAKAGRPYRSCDLGECNRCSNTIEALNRVIREENTRRTSGTGASFRRRVGRELEPTLPLHELGDALSDDDDEDELAGIENNNPPPNTQSCPLTIRSMTALCERCCRLLLKPTKTTTTMTHHPRLSALRPMGVMQ
jgi:hypothetical protein